VGKRYRSPSPACELVLNTIQSIEGHADYSKVGVVGSMGMPYAMGGTSTIVQNYPSTNYMGQIQSELEKIYPVHDSMSELQYWLVRAIAAVSVVALLLFLFYHD
jgi:hypothetical protein